MGQLCLGMYSLTTNVSDFGSSRGGEKRKKKAANIEKLCGTMGLAEHGGRIRL